MSRERLAAAYEELAAIHAKVADAYAQVAHELSAPIDPAVARTAVSEPSAPTAAVGVVPPAPAATTQERYVNAALGVCPDHHAEWEVQPAGVSKKDGKPYNAFWKCNQKTDGAYCRQKPVKAWLDAHEIREAA